MSRLLQDWVRQAAQRAPERGAVVGEDRTLDYGALESFSNQVAQVLREHGCERGDRVAVLLPKSADAVACLIGILKAGCAYVPLDVGGGLSRTAQILRQCEPTILLTGNDLEEACDNLELRAALRGVRVGCLSTNGPNPHAAFTREDIESAPETDLGGPKGAPGDIAYIMFTSGTTGRPKGVPITHANVIPFIEWAVDAFELGPEDRLSGHTALTFDLSTFDIYATLAAGAELHHVPKKVRLLPAGVAEFVAERALTLWFSVPSQLTYVTKFDALEGVTLPSLRHVAWCGDVLPTPTLLYWKEHLPGVTFTNLYGPTETTVASSYYRVPDSFDDATADIPIGVGCSGEELLVLDDDLRPVPAGEVGNLYIRGVGLSPGYWNDATKTAQAFVLDPASSNGKRRLYRTGDLARVDAEGLVHFLGRADFQIKTSGYRVEPAEVENAILQLDEVQSCVVVPVKVDDFSGNGIGCAYVPSNGAPLRTADAKKRLAERLPGYMIPVRWLVLEELPVDDRGKIDRARAQALLGSTGP